MIYKKTGCHELEKLQVIHLFEADFNLIIGIIFGRWAMFHQIDNKTIHKGKFSLPDRECHDALFQK